MSSTTTSSLSDMLPSTILMLNAEGSNWAIFYIQFMDAIKDKGFWDHFNGLSTACYVPYHRLNSISISTQDIPQTHSWSSYITSCTLPLPIWTIPIPPALYYMQKHLYPIFGTSLVNRLHSTHVYLLSISEYGHAQSRYHMFSFPCHMFVLFFHMLLLLFHMLFPNSSTCSLPFVTHHVSSLEYISFEYPSCISLVSNIRSSSPLLSHFISEV